VYLPSSQPLVADGLLIARTRNGCVALDVESLGIVWNRQQPHAQLFHGSPFGAWLEEHVAVSRRGMLDSLSASIAICENLILTVEQQQRVDSEVMRARVQARMRPWRLRLPLDELIEPATTRLTARELRSGVIRWERGGAHDPDDALGDVQFRSAGLAVDADEDGDIELWVPYVRQNDLIVGVLSPRDGVLLREIVLCTLGRSWQQVDYVLEPACADGIVYVPSAHGALFAIDARDNTPRWAVQYADTVDESGEWAPSPPVVSNGTVVLAPPERDELMAFSVDNGHMRWATHVPGGYYIIGVDRGRAWVAGRGIYCISLADGRIQWSTELESSATGRAALSGERIYVPTYEGLTALRANDGRIAERQVLSDAQRPLGNLLCLDGALYSLDPSSVRKYPDLKEAYPRVVAAYEADPTDVKTATRLAWMEHLKGNSGRAEEILDLVPQSYWEGEGPRALELAHLKVQVLLALAGDLQGRSGEALALLEEARSHARASRDQLDCGLAVGERLAEEGRHVEAYQNLWRLGLGKAGDHLIPCDDRTKCPARLEIRDRLERITTNLSSSEKRKLRAFIFDRFDEHRMLAAQESAHQELRHRLRAMADLGSLGEGAQLALLQLGHMSLASQRFEEAEQWLKRSIRLNIDPELTAAALMALCDLYASSRVGLASCLEWALGELDARFGNGPVPALYGDNAWTGRTVQKWVATVRSGIHPEELMRYRFHDLRPGFGFSDVKAWELELPGNVPDPRMVHFDRPMPAALADHVLYYGWDETLACVGTSDGAVRWHTSLRIPGEFRPYEERLFGSSRWNEGNPLLPLEKGFVARRAVANGQTMVMAGPNGLHAVGLLTGRRLWVRRYDAPRPGAIWGSVDQALAAGGGVVAGLLPAGKLTLMDIVDGSTVWTHDLRGERIERICIRGDRVITVDPARERVHLFDLNEGKLVKEILFNNILDNEIELIVTDELICGPECTAQLDRVAAYDLETGERKWRILAGKPLATLFMPTRAHVALGLLRGHVSVLDAQTGRQVFECSVPSSHPIVSGVWHDRTLILKSIESDQGLECPRIFAVDAGSGTLLWERADLVPTLIYDPPLDLFDGMLPLLFHPAPFRQGEEVPPVWLELVAARTGRAVETAFELVPMGAAHHFTGDLGYWSDAMVFGMDHRIRAYATHLRTTSNPRSPDWR
jgi:outer membrane protein assembly factor BamB